MFAMKVVNKSDVGLQTREMVVSSYGYIDNRTAVSLIMVIRFIVCSLNSIMFI